MIRAHYVTLRVVHQQITDRSRPSANINGQTERPTLNTRQSASQYIIESIRTHTRNLFCTRARYYFESPSKHAHEYGTFVIVTRFQPTQLGVSESPSTLAYLIASHIKQITHTLALTRR